MWCKKADIQDDEIRKQEIKHGDLKRKFDKLTEKAASGHEFRKKIELIERSQQALEKYHDSLIESKISTLQSHFAESFAVLLRKENYISRISINRDDFSATLFDANNNPVPKEELSAGEKQIFAVAMLWALAKTSGRMLPVIIDTPLGRLDSEHRYHLIERYFPFASHQVIILSTDTEVDENYFQALAPWTARTFHLRYDQSDECTYVENKYFDFIDNKKELTGVAD
jgi:DNA sulfur modification protein DndD